MRFYRLEITDAVSGKPLVPSSLGGMPITSLLPNGQTNPAALNIELDIPVAPQGVPGDGQTIVTIWGLSLLDIRTSYGLGIQSAAASTQATQAVQGAPFRGVTATPASPGDFTITNPNPPATGTAAPSNGAQIKVFGGMAKGLPLANPAQQGPLVVGSIIQAFGNWVGTEQYVSLILTQPTGTQEDPKNIILNWQAGQPLSTALTNTLNTAFPGIPVRMNISPKLVQQHTEAGYHYSLGQLNDVALRLSKAIIKAPNYQGVAIFHNGTNITVSDGTTKPAPKMIAFQDMIGQPTWIGLNTIQVKLVMRGDLAIGDVIKIPPSLVTTQGQTQQNLNPSFFSTFSGSFMISDMHHYGNFRQPPADSWNTTINAFVDTTTPAAPAPASDGRPGIH